VHHVASQATTNVHFSGGNLPWNDNELQSFGGKRQRSDSDDNRTSKQSDSLFPFEEEEDGLGEIILLEITCIDVTTVHAELSSVAHTTVLLSGGRDSLIV
jgi:hypothetical protein